jgi:hypothetical protein
MKEQEKSKIELLKIMKIIGKKAKVKGLNQKN